MIRARLRAALLLVALAVTPLSQGAPYLQWGYDAARTGATPDPGPATNDVAFVVRLPAPLASPGPPLILGDSVVLATADGTTPGAGGLHRIGLADATVVRVADLRTAPTAIASDGERIVVAEQDALRAYSLDGARLWEASYPASAGAAAGAITRCAPLAVSAEVVFAGCARRTAGATVPNAWPLGVEESAAFAMAVRLATGEQVWAQERRPEAEPTGALENPDQAFQPLTSHVVQVALFGDMLLVAYADQREAWKPRTEVAALDATTGQPRWRVFASPSRGAPTLEPTYYAGEAFEDFPAITVGGDVAHVRMNDWIQTYDAEGRLRHEMLLGDATARGAASALASSGDALFSCFGESLWRYDVAQRYVVWGVHRPKEWCDAAGMLVAGDGIYAAVGTSVLERAVLALDASGTVRWRAPWAAIEAAPMSIAVGQGVLVIASGDGHAAVVGRTAASLQVAARVEDGWPALGAAARVDLSGTTAGAMGPPDAFRVEWGDGTVSEWQPSPRFEHVYQGEGERVARLMARNAAGQTASAFVTFHVGGSPPSAPTFLETQFAAENQERTFFVLGLLVTLLAALAGVLRIRRRRARLQRELRALEQAFAQARRNLPECERVLAEHRARARDLVREGTLEESHGSILLARAAELGQELRMATIELEFDFLPHRIVRTLHDMLRDGRVNVWEREHVLRLVEEDPVMTPDQKARVRTLVDHWHARDSSASVGAEAAA